MSEVLSENELRDRIMLLGHELIDAEHFLKYANEIIESHRALQRRVEELEQERNRPRAIHSCDIPGCRACNNPEMPWDDEDEQLAQSL